MAKAGLHLERTCEQCGKVYRQWGSNQQFCSKLCGQRAWYARRRVMLTCGNCGIEFQRRYANQRYCSVTCRTAVDTERKAAKYRGGPGKGWAKGVQVGPLNPSWKGDDIRYASFHKRVEVARGKARKCSNCGTTDPARTYDWANLTGNYADTGDYARMCRPCHRRFDNERRRNALGGAA